LDQAGTNLWGTDMQPFLAALTVAAFLAPLSASAQERVGDAALGGLSGALVLGPVGAVAGIIVGYTAGPSISRSWGLNRGVARAPGRPAPRPTAARSNAAKPVRSASAAAARPAAATKPAWNGPPVVGFE